MGLVVAQFYGAKTARKLKSGEGETALTTGGQSSAQLVDYLLISGRRKVNTL